MKFSLQPVDQKTQNRSAASRQNSNYLFSDSISSVAVGEARRGCVRARTKPGVEMEHMLPEEKQLLQVTGKQRVGLSRVCG